MDTVNMFKIATKNGYRFSTPQGDLTTEDLWNLPLESKSANKANLDMIAIELHKKINNTVATSFIYKDRKPDTETEIKFAIVKSVIEDKLQEQEMKRQAMDKAEEKRKLLDTLARKKDAALEELTVEDLTARINAL